MADLNDWLQQNFELRIQHETLDNQLDMILEYIDVELEIVKTDKTVEYVDMMLDLFDVHNERMRKLIYNTIDWDTLEKCIMNTYKEVISELNES